MVDVAAVHTHEKGFVIISEAYRAGRLIIKMYLPGRLRHKAIITITKHKQMPISRTRKQTRPIKRQPHLRNLTGTVIAPGRLLPIDPDVEPARPTPQHKEDQPVVAADRVDDVDDVGDAPHVDDFVGGEGEADDALLVGAQEEDAVLEVVFLDYAEGFGG